MKGHGYAVIAMSLSGTVLVSVGTQFGKVAKFITNFQMATRLNTLVFSELYSAVM